MKFTDLTGQQRSMLTMLCTGQSFNTDELGRGTVPQMHPRDAAQVLMEMRAAGLVFSSQKMAAQTYAAWRASDYGKMVFEGRPADVVSPVLGTPDKPVASFTAYTYVVYQASKIAGHAEYQIQCISESEAFAEAARLTEAHKREFFVAKLVGRSRPVVQPTHVIERV